MTEYTPTYLDGVLDLVAQVRDEASLASRAGQAAALGELADELESSIRALAVQVRAEALRQAAESYVYVHAVSRVHSTVYRWLLARAGRIADTNQHDRSTS